MMPGRASRWPSTAARLVLAAVFLAAGATKVGDPEAAGQAVAAYRLLPYELATAVGAALPFAELALGGLLLAGLATRAGALLAAGLLVLFAGAVASVWARGLAIDCGCFGGGGAATGDPVPGYLLDLGRDGVLLVLAGFLAHRPDSRLSLDTVLLAPKEAR